MFSIPQTGQALASHSFAVGYLAYRLFDLLNIDNQSLANTAFVAGALHALGMSDPAFQKGVKLNPDKYPTYNELSYLFAYSLLQNSRIFNKGQVSQILHSVYFHAPIPPRKQTKYFSIPDGIEKLFLKKNKADDTFWDKHLLRIKDFIGLVSDITLSYHPQLSNLLGDFNYRYESPAVLPVYKAYREVADTLPEFKQDCDKNALNNMVRTSVMWAHNLVAGLSADTLEHAIATKTLDDLLTIATEPNSDLIAGIDGYLQRLKQEQTAEQHASQISLVEKLTDIATIAKIEKNDSVAVFQDMAGDNTLPVVLAWAANTQAKKIIWVCPRVQLCLNVLDQLTQSDCLSNNCIEIFTGEFKYLLENGMSLADAPMTHPSNYFSGDIIITTIDQVVNNIITSERMAGMIDFMQSHVVFEACHEFVTVPTLSLLFAELVASKRLQKDKANTLLLSTTPHYLYLNEILAIKDNRLVATSVTHDVSYSLDFAQYSDTNPMQSLVAPDDKSTFFISNTAKTAQIGFINQQKAENAILIHTKYTKKDKALLHQNIFNCFGQNGSHAYHVMRGSSVIEGFSGIHCERLFTDITTAEKWLQRIMLLGDRSDLSVINTCTTFIPDSHKNSGALLLSNMHSWHAATAWMDFLKQFCANQGDKVKLSDLYQYYRLFYAHNKHSDKVRKDLVATLTEGVYLISRKLADPISKPVYVQEEETPLRIPEISLRSDAVFIQAAQVLIDDDCEVHFLDQYAYDEADMNAVLTEDVFKITGGGEKRDHRYDLLAFMHKKHHQIKPVVAAHFDWQLLQLARSPNNPIYLSYTPDDLSNAHCQPHPNAIYYMQTAKQAIGIMPLSYLQN